ncbi:MAG TPA: hypothetical protein ENG22_04980 [Candidatus Bathyarchaeota archaeon]|nr:hypothetical protein [Candidatus Bathyarchaeota archaeon]
MLKQINPKKMNPWLIAHSLLESTLGISNLPPLGSRSLVSLTYRVALLCLIYIANVTIAYGVTNA